MGRGYETTQGVLGGISQWYDLFWLGYGILIG
jgi:hypothetical protein